MPLPLPVPVPVPVPGSVRGLERSSAVRHHPYARPQPSVSVLPPRRMSDELHPSIHPHTADESWRHSPTHDWYARPCAADGGASAPPLEYAFNATASSRAPPIKRRGKLPKEVTELLRTWLLDHVGHPYPTEDEKRHLCDATGLTMNQISNWFINARRRILAPVDSASTSWAA